MIKHLIRIWLLRLFEKILGEDVEPEEKKLLAVCYKRLLDERNIIEEGK